MPRRRLRIGITPALLSAPRATGHGNMWHHVLAGLTARRGVEVRPLHDDRKIDVVLVDGHEKLPATSRPLVAHLHEAGWGTPELRATIDADFLATIEPNTIAAASRAAAVITPSASSRAQIVAASGCPVERVTVVAHGVDTGTFHPGASTSPPASPYVLYAGTVLPRKNLPVLREAMDELAQRGLPHTLTVVVGPAPDRADNDSLLEAARMCLARSGRPVTDAGQPDDVSLAGLMAGADVLCLPSLMEGFGLPVLEAMACGTPAVVANRGALPEVVGDTGVIVEPTVAGVTEGLAALLTDDERRARIGAAAHRRASAMTWDRAVDGWLEVLRAVGSG